jgi:receptor expression-enhancing protein 5/6
MNPKIEENKKILDKVLQNKQKENKEKEEYSLLNKFHSQMNIIKNCTGIEGVYVIIALLISILVVSFGWFDKLITNLIGTIYPTYWTLKSIQSENSDDKYWLTYWVVFASFSIIDIFSVILIKFIPFYFIFKICFLIWLFMPNSQGCYYIYYFVIVKLFKKVEKDIDNASEKIGEYTKNIVLQGNDIIEKTINKSKESKKGNLIKVTENPFKPEENIEEENSNTNQNEEKLKKTNNDILNQKNKDNLLPKTANVSINSPSPFKKKLK